jgi:hypothetical protein
MIKINVQTNSKGGVVVAAGSVLNISPRIITVKERVNIAAEGEEPEYEIQTKFNVVIDTELFKSFESWKSDVNVRPLITNDDMVEYPVVEILKNLPLADLNPAAIQNLYKEVIENGNDRYPGIGVGNAEIINA